MTCLPSSVQASRNGSALVIVLAFVVLLSGLLVAYLTRAGIDRQLAQASFHDTKSDLLARSALDIIVADFKQEIGDGTPVTPANIQPRRWGTPPPGGTPFPNLIRRSMQGDPTGQTSSLSSGPVPSANPKRGEIIPARWNSHYLLPRASSSGNDSTPVSNFAAPDWVLVTPQGPNPAPSPSAVIGRYAYAVYDEGGMLDVNTAGFPYHAAPSQSPTPGLPLNDIGRKGSVAFADLRALPTTTTALLSAGGVNAIVGWRNFATVRPSAVFPNFSFDSPVVPGGTGTRFVNYFAGNPSIGLSQGFRTVSPTVHLNRTDQAFVTRTELIKLQREAGFGAGALQYLGTFSCERNAPTWKAGTAVITQRFYIGHLNLVTPNPTGPRVADIQKYFGLRWIDGTPGQASPPTPAVPGHWQYVGTSGNTMQDRIPAFTNDPEFFQLLNYAINRTNGDDSSHLLTTLSVGAALIDQYDDDPAADPLTGTTTTMIEYSGGWAVGLENLDPARASPSPAPSPFPQPAGMSPTPPPAIPAYVMLNRPFRNAGEFGYAFRAASGPTPTPSPNPKTLDFFTPTSSDAPILDLFTYNSAPLRSGTVNLNTQNVAVLTAILTGAFQTEQNVGPAPSPSPVASPAAKSAATNIVNATTSQAALSRADLARLSSSVINAPFTTNEETRETVARALSEVTQIRAWGLLIDVITQTGRYPPGTTSLTQPFVVEGEKRYWLHIAIDRFTGQVIDRQLEAVSE
ncbi:MAG: hypothetical protein DMF06_01225 [Verrucomicrobia bacterium]|nr:MAG: hypothetical protein DMF06_01225 [Verrucomicrobiota bacterium]